MYDKIHYDIKNKKKNYVQKKINMVYKLYKNVFAFPMVVENISFRITQTRF